MLKLKRSLAAAALLTLLALPAAAQEQKKTDKTQPPQDVNVTNVVPTHPSVPPGAFSFSGGVGKISGPDPEGTSYAITSFTVFNISSNLPTLVGLVATFGSTSDCESFSAGSVSGSTGPFASVPADQTIHFTFPQPFVISAQPGAAACLSSGGTDAIVTVVGYRIPPPAQPQQ